jgi:hypothetical protein
MSVARLIGIGIYLQHYPTKIVIFLATTDLEAVKNFNYLPVNPQVNRQVMVLFIKLKMPAQYQ